MPCQIAMTSTPAHHPDDALLLAYAAGTLAPAPALVLGAHLETCAACRRSLALLDQVGGEVLQSLAPQALDAGAFSRTLARLDASTAHALPAASPARHALRPDAPAASPAPAAAAWPDAPAGMPWPRSLQGCRLTPWRRIGPGMRWSRVHVPGQPEANSFLLRMAAGLELAAHTHTGRELTQVLHGAFDDGRAIWRAGDLDEAGTDVHHRPTVGVTEECVCLVAVDGRVQFDGWLARGLGAWMGI